VGLASAEAEGLGFWDDVYGLDMKAVGGALREQGMRQTIVRVAEPSSLLSDGVMFRSLDLATMTRAEQDFSSELFELVPGDEHRQNDETCSSFVIWFDTEFSSRFCAETPVVLDTSPSSKPTHWAQTVLPLKNHIRLSDCDMIKGRISMSRQESVHRSLDISVEYSCVVRGVEGPLVTQLYSIGVRD
jgi:protein arginine N-methyltransferase 3